MVPIRVVDEDLIGADDSGDDRDVTGGNALRAPEDEDRAHRRDLAALVAPLGLGPPAAGRAKKCDTRDPACVKRAISSGRRFDRSDDTRSKTSAPQEAVRHQRSH